MRQGAAALVALGFFATACGNGGGPRLSKPEFQRTANSICTRYEQRVGAAGSPRNLASLAQIADRAYAAGKRERSALAQVRPPGSLDDRYRELLDRMARVDALLPKLRTAAANGQKRRVTALARKGGELVRGVNADAGALGLVDCRRG